MGFLEKLWDETLAGPTPETGLGKLRKYNSFSASSSGVRSTAATVKEDIPISRSIKIIRTHSNFGGIRNAVSEPVSPSSSLNSSAPITPRSPLTPETPGGNVKKFTRRKLRVESATDHFEV